MHPTLSFLAALSLSGALAAQSTALIPASSFNNEGHSGVVLPFNDQNLIFQQWMPPADVGIPNNARIVGVAFIREGNFANVTTFLQSFGWTLDRVEVRLAAGAATFTTNGVTNWDTAAIPPANFSQASFVIPPYQSPAATGPAVELVRIMFTTSTQYDNTKPLLLEVRNIATSQTNANPPAGSQVLTDRNLPTGFGAVRGWGCANNAAQTPAYGGFGGLFVVPSATTGQILYPSATVGAWAMLLGFQFNTVLAQPPGLVLNTLPGLGAVGPNCRIWVDPFLALAGSGTTSPFTFNLTIPAGAPLGLPIGWQPLFFDTNAPGSLTVGPGLYAYLRSSATNNATRVAAYFGAGDLSATATQPALASISPTAPIQSYAVSVRVLYQ